IISLFIRASARRSRNRTKNIRMMEQRPSLMQKLWKTARGPVYFVLFLWLLLLFDYLTGRHLGTLGVLPRRLSGLKGILFSPLIHGSAGHLFNNSIPLLISSMV